MNLLNLEYFLIAAEELNFTRAANRLHIAQQSLSNHITKLESHFGTELFDRTPPMSLTPAGLCFQRYAKLMRNTMGEMEQEIQDIKDFKKSELTIGLTPARGAAYLPLLFPKFNRAFPLMKVNLVEGDSSRLENLLREAKIDMIIGLLPKDPLGLTSEVVWKEKYILAVPNKLMEEYLPGKRKELLQNPGQVSLKEFEALPFLAIQKNLRTGRIFHNICAKDDMMPNVIMESRNINIVLSLCVEGMGALVCPMVYLYPYQEKIGEERFEELSIFPLGYSDDIAISYLSSKYFSVGAQKFKEMVKEIGRGIGEKG